MSFSRHRWFGLAFVLGIGICQAAGSYCQELGQRPDAEKDAGPDQKSEGKGQYDRPPRPPRADPIASALAEPAKFDLKDASLAKIAEELHQQYSIPVELDSRALAESRVAGSVKVTWSIRGVPLRSALRRLLGEAGLTYAVADDILLITTPQGAARVATVHTYDVRELLAGGESAYLLASSIEDALTRRASRLAPTSPLDPMATRQRAQVISRPAYTQTPAPRVRHITPYRNVLIIRDTTTGHEEVAELLDQLLALVHIPQELPPGAPSGFYTPPSGQPSPPSGDNRRPGLEDPRDDSRQDPRQDSRQDRRERPMGDRDQIPAPRNHPDRPQAPAPIPSG